MHFFPFLTTHHFCPTCMLLTCYIGHTYASWSFYYEYVLDTLNNFELVSCNPRLGSLFSDFCFKVNTWNLFIVGSAFKHIKGGALCAQCKGNWTWAIQNWVSRKNNITCKERPSKSITYDPCSYMSSLDIGNTLSSFNIMYKSPSIMVA
jgi:hypothetical protein